MPENPIIIEGEAVEVSSGDAPPRSPKDAPGTPDAGFTAVPPGSETRSDPPRADAPRNQHAGFHASDWRENWWGMGALMLAASLMGALLAILFQLAGGSGDASDVDERLADMEVRIGQIAAGNPDAAAQSAYADLAAVVDGLSLRVQALEASMAAMETEPGNTPPVEDNTPPTTLPEGGNTSLDAKVDAAVRMLSELSGRIDVLEGAGGGTGPSTGAGAQEILALRQALDDARARLSALELATGPALSERLSGYATLAAQTAIESRVGELERNNSAAASRRAARALALLQLVRASEGEAPFTRELELLADINGARDEFAALQPVAATGAATLETLAAEFDDVAYRLIEVERDAAAQDWLDRLWNNMIALVASRATGEVSGDGAEARAARAEMRMGEGRLSDAVAEIDALPENVRKAAEPWLSRARARAALDAQLAALTNALIQSLAGEGNGASKDLNRPANPANVPDVSPGTAP